MCGFTTFFHSWEDELTKPYAHRVKESLEVISHRGPDGSNIWKSPCSSALMGHVRLAIIDLNQGSQPMVDTTGRYTIVFNGELYNYKELITQLGLSVETHSDTEVILQCYISKGAECLKYFLGMFAFIIWDNVKRTAFVARDRFGIKPLYVTEAKDGIALSSEVKGLLPFWSKKQVNQLGLSDYLNFQCTLSQRTLFEGIYEFPAAHYAFINEGGLDKPIRYWNLQYNVDYHHTERWFCERLREKLSEAVTLHCTSDVPIASYVSGGIDSTLISALSIGHRNSEFPMGFVGRYITDEGFDESEFASDACEHQGVECNVVTITPDDFVATFERLIWHLDQPVAGPGSVGQYIVSREASKYVKVILGGQGGDEIFGGYTRYLIGYFEQCIRGAIDGTLNGGNYLVTYESIIPSLRSLEQYIPLLQEFWSEGIFDSLDKRYWQLINKAKQYDGIVWQEYLNSKAAEESYNVIFYADGTEHASYFDRMSHYDFRTLLPALLHVEDRVSMAHGLESRVPFLDHRLVEFAATIPADIKFRNGELKRMLPLAFTDKFPISILNRKDKMGFPIPLNSWMKKHKNVREYIGDIFSSSTARQRPYLIKPIPVDEILASQGNYGRALWGLLCLEIWQRLYID
jgi:asparagine synthase (glutamine-hydrolysing)